MRLGGLVEYKDQVSYGLHVIVVMGVFYLMGHFTASRLSPKPSIVGFLPMLSSQHLIMTGRIRQQSTWHPSIPL